MERVDYQTVLEGVADLAGLDRDNVSNAEFGTLRGFCSRRLKTAWEHQLWPEVKRCEERWFRPFFDSGATYAAGAEVFDARVSNYFQALRSPSMGNSVTNAAGLVATLTLPVAHGLAVGRTVWITVSGISSSFNGLWLATASGTTDLVYTMGSAPGVGPYATGTVMIHPTGGDGLEVSSFWAGCASSYTGDNWVTGTAYLVGRILYWPQTGRFYQVHTAHTSSQTLVPTNTTYYGVLTVFDRYIGYTQGVSAGVSWAAIGTVLGCWASNPRVYVKGQASTSADAIEWWLSENGVQVVTSTRKSVWLEYRVRTPNLKGVTWAAASTYTGGFSQVYYSDAATPGNFYDCVTTTAAGESPVTTPAKWSLVEIPRRFEQHLVYAATRDWLLSQGQAEKWALLKVDVADLLSDQVLVLKGQSGQEERLVCGTR
jgi:hypothetical protein